MERLLVIYQTDEEIQEWKGAQEHGKLAFSFPHASEMPFHCQSQGMEDSYSSLPQCWPFIYNLRFPINPFSSPPIAENTRSFPQLLQFIIRVSLKQCKLLL